MWQSWELSNGIRQETAFQFAQRGAKLVVSAHSQPRLESLVNEIQQQGGEAIAVTTDVAMFEQVNVISNKTVEQYG